MVVVNCKETDKIFRVSMLLEIHINWCYNIEGFYKGKVFKTMHVWR